MFTVKTKTLHQDGSSTRKMFECGSFEINERPLNGKCEIVVSCFGTTIDHSQDAEFDGQDFAHLDVVSPDVFESSGEYDRDDLASMVFHEVIIENAMGKTTEIVKNNI